MGKCIKWGICQQNHLCTKVPKKVLQTSQVPSYKRFCKPHKFYLIKKCQKKVLQKIGKVQALPYCSSYTFCRESVKLGSSRRCQVLHWKAQFPLFPSPNHCVLRCLQSLSFSIFFWFFFIRKIDILQDYFQTRKIWLDRLNINCAHPLIGCCVYFLFKFPPCFFVWNDNTSPSFTN